MLPIVRSLFGLGFKKMHVMFVIYTRAYRICTRSCRVFFLGRECRVKFVHGGF
jgi:hypothetical protein